MTMKREFLRLGSKVRKLIVSNLMEIQYWRPGYAVSIEGFNVLNPKMGMSS